jgi:hypothetical protein
MAEFKGGRARILVFIPLQYTIPAVAPDTVAALATAASELLRTQSYSNSRIAPAGALIEHITLLCALGPPWYQLDKEDFGGLLCKQTSSVVEALLSLKAPPFIRKPVAAAFHSMVEEIVVPTVGETNQIDIDLSLTAYASVKTCVAEAAIHWKRNNVDIVTSNSA